MQQESMEQLLHAFLLLYPPRQPALPLRQGEKKGFRRSSKSASVPFEGRTLQYDVRTSTQGEG